MAWTTTRVSVTAFENTEVYQSAANGVTVQVRANRPVLIQPTDVAPSNALPLRAGDVVTLGLNTGDELFARAVRLPGDPTALNEIIARVFVTAYAAPGP